MERLPGTYMKYITDYVYVTENKFFIFIVGPKDDENVLTYNYLIISKCVKKRFHDKLWFINES